MAIADTCFLINWLRYRKRDDIFNIYESIGVPLLVLDELGSRRSLLVEWIVTGRVFFIPRISKFETEALSIIEFAKVRRLPRIDPAEAYCLSVAKHRGYDILTDNKAIKYIVSEAEEYKGVKVLDSLDMLVVIYGDIVDELKRAIKEYSEDTGLVFSKMRLREYGLL